MSQIYSYTIPKKPTMGKPGMIQADRNDKTGAVTVTVHQFAGSGAGEAIELDSATAVAFATTILEGAKPAQPAQPAAE